LLLSDFIQKLYFYYYKIICAQIGARRYRNGMHFLYNVILRVSISCFVSNMNISHEYFKWYTMKVHKSHIIKLDGLIIRLRCSSARDHQGSLVTPLSANQHSLITSRIPLSCFL